MIAQDDEDFSASTEGLRIYNGTRKLKGVEEEATVFANDKVILGEIITSRGFDPSKTTPPQYMNGKSKRGLQKTRVKKEQQLDCDDEDEEEDDGDDDGVEVPRVQFETVKFITYGAEVGRCGGCNARLV
jgi:hypothetical protein